jgi:uncharacterized membrane protein
MPLSESKGRLGMVPALLAADVVVLVVSVWIAASAYPRLPHLMATHFNTAGMPNAWAIKSWGLVLLIPIVQLVLVALFGGLSLWVQSSPGSLKRVNLPIDTASLSGEQSTRVRRVTAQGLSILSLVLMVMLTVVHSSILLADASGHAPGGSVMAELVVGVVLCIASVVWMTTGVRGAVRK